MSIQERDLADIWALALKLVQPDIKKLSFDTILKNSSLESLDGNTALVKVQNDFAKDWLATRYTDKIEDALRGLVGTYCKVEYSVVDQAQSAEDKPSAVEKPARQKKARTEYEQEIPVQEKVAHKEAKVMPGRPLQEKYTFDKYYVGLYNDIPYKYIMQMLSGESKLPLIIYSSVGMGKTHLLQAAAHKMLKNNPDAKVAYLSSEDFTNELVSCLNTKTMSTFREQYRQLDMLLIDDIQFFEGKKVTQDEFFFTFNTILEQGKLLILSSDKHPRYLENFQDRLHSRVKAAQIASIQETTYEDRVSILQKWAENRNITLPTYVYDKVASRITESIRELQGAFTNVLTRLNMLGWGKATPELLDSILDEYSPGTKKQTVTVARIQKAVSDYFQINVDDMNASSRVKAVSEARQYAMFICRELLKMPFESIGREFGGRDHATVLHACRKVRKLVEENPSSKTSLKEIEDGLKV